MFMHSWQDVKTVKVCNKTSHFMLTIRKINDGVNASNKNK